GMVERIVEPAERVQIFVAMLGDGEVQYIVRLQKYLCAADLQNVEDLARPLAGKEQAAKGVLDSRLLAVHDDFEEELGLDFRKRLGLPEDCRFLWGRAAVGNGRDLLFLDVVRNAVTGHLVRRVPARPDADVERTRV